MSRLWSWLLPAVVTISAACSGPVGPPPYGTGGSSGEDSSSGGSAADGGAGGEGGEVGEGGAGSGGAPLDVCEGVVCPSSDQECRAAGGGAQCQCKLGETCAAADECEASPGPCAADASCSDLSDGFSCACDSGFSGNGFVCLAGNPCADIECSGDQLCVSDGVVASCQCPAGYMPNGGTACVDVDECNDDAPCAARSLCINFLGGYRCDCDPGFLADGSGCADVDECQTGENACDPDATCQNDTNGGYDCLCGSGVAPYGDGFFCKTTNHCAGDPCNSGQCEQTPTGYRCTCPLGTTGPDCADTSTCGLDVVLTSGGSPILADATLRKNIRQALSFAPTAAVTVADLAGVEDLTVVVSSGDAKVASLAGLECWPTLKSLDISDQDVADLAPIAHLAQLETLDISCTQVDSFQDLVELGNLKRLLANHCIGAPVLSALQIGSLIRLETLEVADHGVSNISALAALKRLRALVLAGNDISDVSMLSGLKSLHTLALDGNPLGDISVFGSIDSLRNLSLFGTGLTSVAALSNNAHLITLNLSSNGLSSATGLGGLNSLRALDLSLNALDSIAALATLTALTDLNIGTNQVSSLQPLVDNPAFGKTGRLLISGNPLPCSTQTSLIASLRSRGLVVQGSCVE